MRDRTDRVELLRELRRAAAVDSIELYLKRGRSRRFVHATGLEHQSEAVERGWAVRGSTDRSSLFRCGTGAPDPAGGWPELGGRPIRLPEPGLPMPWQPPPELEAPLASESELRSLASALEQQIQDELPAARVDHLALEDGQSQSWLENSLGVSESWRGRAATVTLEASLVSRPDRRVRLEVIRRELRELSPRRLVERLVDLMTVRTEGRAVERDRGEIVVAPRVASRLIAALWPIFDPRHSDDLLAAWASGGKLGGPALTLIDNGRLFHGVMAAPVDGEGTPTQEVVLVEDGAFQQPLLAWWMESPGRRTGGCSQRFSWRDEPRVGPSHLYLKPDKGVRAADLVSSVSRGYYLLDSAVEASFDYAADRFSLPVRGFEMLQGRANMPVDGIALVGRITALLAGVREVGRDLAFTPTARGLFGAPTVRLTGLEIREQR